MNRKLTEWSEDEDEDPYALKRNKWNKIAIVRNAFTLQELEEDAAFLLDLKDDFRGEAEKHGIVRNVTVYDKEPQGIVAIRFDDFLAPERFRTAAMARRYNKRWLDITIAEDRPKFKKSTTGGEGNSSDDDRLQRAAAT